MARAVPPVAESMLTYHEKVARAMKASVAAGTFNSYETILAALETKFPTEEGLRAYVKTMEAEAVRVCNATPGWHLVGD